jgi:hypothetical protein
MYIKKLRQIILHVFVIFYIYSVNRISVVVVDDDIFRE